MPTKVFLSSSNAHFVGTHPSEHKQMLIDKANHPPVLYVSKLSGFMSLVQQVSSYDDKR
jgi:hypothetical protein